jgi:hypothetical protein
MKLFAGSTNNLGIIFTPTSPGPHSATITLTSNSTTSPDIINLTGVGAASAVRSDNTTSSISLGAPIPNPAKSEMRISYTIPKRSDIILSLVDVSGKEIQTIVNENSDGGSFEKTLDVRLLPSGSYILKLSACGESVTKVIEVVK